MTQSSIEKHDIEKGTLSFHATKKNHLVFYTGIAGSRGILNMKLENEGKKFIIIPVD